MPEVPFNPNSLDKQSQETIFPDGEYPGYADGLGDANPIGPQNTFDMPARSDVQNPGRMISDAKSQLSTFGQAGDFIDHFSDN